MEEQDEKNAIKVAKYIIKLTPIGHLNKCLDNLKTVVGDKIMDNKEVKEEIYTYGETHLSPVLVPLINSKVVISPLTKDADNYYYDQGQKVKFQIKLDGGAVENAEAIDTPDETRNAVEAKIKSYVEKYYKKDVAKYNVYFDAIPNKLIILISAHNLNLKNFWSGEWLSTWQLDLNKKKVSGTIRANTYYYEEGNVQFNLSTNWDSEIDGEGPDDIAANLLEFIEKSENSVQIDLEKVYDDFSDLYIKPLRRKLPVTGTKMNWSLNQIQLNQ